MALTFLKWDRFYFKIVADEAAVTEISRVEIPDAADESQLTRQAAAELQAYFTGHCQDFTFPIRAVGTPFQQAVWAALQALPFGKTTCYSEIAAAIGRPSAIRAVGQAIGRNPILIVIPCHRVLGKNGSLTGFSAGLDLKKCLLSLEQLPGFLGKL